jgi:hypothetical protein
MKIATRVSIRVKPLDLEACLPTGDVSEGTKLEAEESCDFNLYFVSLREMSRRDINGNLKLYFIKYY